MSKKLSASDLELFRYENKAFYLTKDITEMSLIPPILEGVFVGETAEEQAKQALDQCIQEGLIIP
jgi:hypothetical protein